MSKSTLIFLFFFCFLFSFHAFAEESGLDYIVEFVTPKGHDKLADEMKSKSQLIWMHKEQLPDGELALERRVIADEENAKKLLRSMGYYEGEIKREIDWDAKPVKIKITFIPRQQFTLSQSKILYSFSLLSPSHSPPLNDEEIFPRSLAVFGLKDGDPAIAKNILDSVDKIAEHLERHGYPKSRIVKTEYILLPEKRQLEANIIVDPGIFLRMGALKIENIPHINEMYLQRLVTWREGEPWNADLVNKYRIALQETGLFSLINLDPDINEKKLFEDTVSVLFKGTEAPLRTIGGGVRYSTDKGPGINAFWEHRNFLGAGENLRIRMPISQDLQMLSASFRKPEFGQHNQALIIDGELRKEKTDAYDSQSAYGAAGIERRLSGDWNKWWISARGSVEGGQIKDHFKGTKDYELFGIPLEVRRDGTNDLFNPTSGTRLSFNATPYSGFYDGPISTIRLRIDASGYYSVTNSDRLVLAVRGGTGSLLGASTQSIPAPLRFYVGGGGSVRGYKYQTVGPMINGDPAGGLSFTDMSFEARFRIGENFGIVPFLDGGMVYSDTTPTFNQSLNWGTGLGFRYYTPIGPIRLDLGVPLQDREHQKKLQVYFSIGQAF